MFTQGCFGELISAPPSQAAAHHESSSQLQLVFSRPPTPRALHSSCCHLYGQARFSCFYVSSGRFTLLLYGVRHGHKVTAQLAAFAFKDRLPLGPRPEPGTGAADTYFPASREKRKLCSTSFTCFAFRCLQASARLA